MKFPENVSREQKVNSEQEGAKEKVLGNNAGDWRGAGS